MITGRVIFVLVVVLFSNVLTVVEAQPQRRRVSCPHICFPRFAHGRRFASKLCSRPRYRSDCVVRSCTVFRRHIRGFACARPLPSPSPSSSPSPSPTASPEPSFSDLTFRTGPLSSSALVSSTDAESDDQYSFSFNGTLNANGVVSLDAVAFAIDSVECTEEGTIRIKTLSDVALTQSLEQMYPNNSVLVISRALFGECTLLPNEVSEDVPDSDRSREFADTYLIVESVTGSPTDAFIRGTPTGFFALFDTANLQVSRIAPAANSTALAPVTRPFNVAAQANVFSLGPLQVEAKVSARDNGNFDVLEADWGLGGLNIEFRVTTDVSVEAELGAKLAVGSPTIPLKSFSLVSVPIYGIPEFALFNRLDDRIGNWSLPNFKLGVFFEIPLVLSIRGEIGIELDAKATGTYNFGRKQLVYFAKGPFTNLDVGVREEANEPASTSFTFNPPRDGIFGDSPVALSVTAFAGIRPQIALYAAILNARLSGDAGVEIEAKTALTNAFPPAPGGVATFGQCETCHKVEVKGDAVLGNIGVFAKLGLETPPVNIFGRSFSIPVAVKLFTLTLPGNPSLRSTLVQACYVPEFGDNTELCGQQECCDSEIEECVTTDSGEKQCSASPSPSITPSPTPTNSPTTTPTPTPSPTPDDGSTSNMYTDPHIRTFDGLSYDCQASGEFIIVQSRSLGLEIQARYSGPNFRGSVTTGIVVRQRGFPTVQMSMAQVNGSLSTSISGCPVSLFVNGAERNVTDNVGDGNADVSLSGSRVIIRLLSGVRLTFRPRRSSFFGCYFEGLETFLPRDIVDSGSVVGLLGSPNNNFGDDWMKRSGEIVPLPNSSSDRIFAPAYNYCTQNWCIRNASESLFVYEQGLNHTSFDLCGVPFGSPIDLNSASPELVALCGEDRACLVDGLVGDIDDAASSLQAQAEADTRSSRVAALKFEPAVVAVNTAVNVLIMLNTTKIANSLPDGLQNFALFRVDPVTGNPGSAPIISLEDNGEPGFSDETSGDGVYSNLLAVQSSTAGEVFGFRAVPVISGNPVGTSLLAVTVPTAVRSYSSQSGIGVVVDSNITSVSVPNQQFEAYDLVVKYTWGSDQSDLDTGTRFLDGIVGFRCSPSGQFMTFSGDNTGTGGSETIVVRVNAARAQGLWTSSTNVTANAGWYRRAQGPATLRVFLRENDTLSEVSGSGLSSVVSPGVQSNCASTLVGTVNIDVGVNDTTVSLVSQP